MTKLQLEQYEKIAEAILFAGGEPVDQKVVAQAMEVDEDAAVAVLESLKSSGSTRPIKPKNIKKSTTKSKALNASKKVRCNLLTKVFIMKRSSQFAPKNLKEDVIIFKL